MKSIDELEDDVESEFGKFNSVRGRRSAWWSMGWNPGALKSGQNWEDVLQYFGIIWLEPSDGRAMGEVVKPFSILCDVENKRESSVIPAWTTLGYPSRKLVQDGVCTELNPKRKMMQQTGEFCEQVGNVVKEWCMYS